MMSMAEFVILLPCINVDSRPTLVHQVRRGNIGCVFCFGDPMSKSCHVYSIPMRILTPGLLYTSNLGDIG